MTTSIKISAHCDPETKEVHVIIKEVGIVEVGKTILQDGEILEVYAYDSREIIVKEVDK